MSTVTGFGAHEGHSVHQHNHSGQPSDRGAWCSKRWLCVTCADGDLPRGVWFDGPACARPPNPALNGRGGEMKGGKR